MTVMRKSIVVVSDGRPCFEGLAGALEREGYAVVSCAEPGRAHAVVRATMPDTERATALGRATHGR